MKDNSHVSPAGGNHNPNILQSLERIFMAKFDRNVVLEVELKHDLPELLERRLVLVVKGKGQY